MLYIKDNDKKSLVTWHVTCCYVHLNQRTLGKSFKNSNFSHQNQFWKTFRTAGHLLLFRLWYLVLKLESLPSDWHHFVFNIIGGVELAYVLYFCFTCLKNWGVSVYTNIAGIDILRCRQVDSLSFKQKQEFLPHAIESARLQRKSFKNIPSAFSTSSQEYLLSAGLEKVLLQFLG